MLKKDDYRDRNRRGEGGVNKARIWPCNMCGKTFSTYGEQKRHLSRAHGKSTAGYDRVLRDDLEGANRRR